MKIMKLLLIPISIKPLFRPMIDKIKDILDEIHLWLMRIE